MAAEILRVLEERTGSAEQRVRSWKDRLEGNDVALAAQDSIQQRLVEFDAVTEVFGLEL